MEARHAHVAGHWPFPLIEARRAEIETKSARASPGNTEDFPRASVLASILVAIDDEG